MKQDGPRLYGPTTTRLREIIAWGTGKPIGNAGVQDAADRIWREFFAAERVTTPNPTSDAPTVDQLHQMFDAVDSERLAQELREAKP